MSRTTRVKCIFRGHVPTLPAAQVASWSSCWLTAVYVSASLQRRATLITGAERRAFDNSLFIRNRSDCAAHDLRLLAHLQPVVFCSRPIFLHGVESRACQWWPLISLRLLLFHLVSLSLSLSPSCSSSPTSWGCWMAASHDANTLTVRWPADKEMWARCRAGNVCACVFGACE